MYFVAFFSILIAVSAGKRPPMPGLPKTYPIKAGSTAPKPCCSPAQFTHKVDVNTVESRMGELLVKLDLGHMAYDSINQLLGGENTVQLSNGTDYDDKFILDYNKLKGYYITKNKGVVDCKKFEIPESKFPENCLPDDAVFVGAPTLGDRALVSDQWYVSRNSSYGETAHIVYSIKAEGCVDLGSYLRVFDSSTGAEIRSVSGNWYDVNLGIDDPARWFKPPPECEGAKVTDIPTRLLRSPMYGGKVTLFD